MEHFSNIESSSEKDKLVNKRKSINLTYGKNEKYNIDFLNKGSRLVIEAKTFSDILTIIYSSTFSLEDIKKVKYFNDDYKSIDDCLSEIFDGLNKNETNIEKINEETININIPLNKKYPFITFSLKKIEKNENQKYSELLNIVINLKKQQESEIKFLKNKINFLENLLKAKTNVDYKKGLESFSGSVIEMTCFGKNEIEKYFDLKQDYSDLKKTYYNKNPNCFSLVFKCKDDKDIPKVVEAFKKIKNDYYASKDMLTRVENNKLFVEILFDAKDLFEMDFNLDAICFSSGESLIIKTKAIPKDIFEEFNEAKMLNFILDTELEFKNLSPQLQIFAYYFQIVASLFPTYLQEIIKDIYFNLVNGNYKYKVPKSLIEGKVEEIYSSLKNIIYDFAIVLLRLNNFEEYKKINFDEIEFNLISTKYKVGFNYKLKVPNYNELIDNFINGKIK